MFKPMLATDADLNNLKFPLLASAKLDGVRATVRDGVVYSRSNKPIPNAFVQEQLRHLEHFDGELIVGDPTSKTCYRDTVSHVMSHDKRDFALKYFVFDHVRDCGVPYTQRLDRIKDSAKSQCVVYHRQHVVNNLEQLLAFEEQLLEEGYEGLILRANDAPYKFGRSTVREGFLLKLKRFSDSEFTVIGFEERLHNGNTATTNELGRTKRSSHAAGKTPLGDLGALVLQGDGFTFNCGTGFTDDERSAIWNNQDAYLGQVAKVKHFEVGVKTAPRHPVFLGWRDRSDL